MIESDWSARPGAPELVERAKKVEAVEAAAWKACFDLAAGGELGGLTAESGGATVMRVAKLPVGMFCKVIGLGMERPATTDDVARILAWFSEAGVDDVWFQPLPAAEPAGLLPLLERSDVRPVAREWGQFVFGAEAPPHVETDLDIREVGPEAAADFSRTVIAGFGLPAFTEPMIGALPGHGGWRAYVAYDGGRPAACGAVFTQGSAALLGFGATLAEYRRRGAQRALLARRVRDALDAGCDTICTQTGVDPEGEGPSWRNIVGTGFRLLYVRPNCSPKAGR